VSWVALAGLAAVAGAAGSWAQAYISRRRDKERLAAAVRLAEQLPGLVKRLEEVTSRIVRVETRLDERDRQETTAALRGIARR